MSEQTENISNMLPYAVNMFKVAVKSELGMIGLCLVVLAILVYFLFHNASEKARIGSLAILIGGVISFSLALNFRAEPLENPIQPEEQKETITLVLNKQTDSTANTYDESSQPSEATLDPNTLKATALPPEATPEMVRIEAGSFLMGSNGGSMDNRPAHTVTIPQPFSISKTEITVGQYRHYAIATNATVQVLDTNPRAKDLPITKVSFNDALAYTKWLSQQTGKHYRLPSEAEWEYAARGGTTSKHWWGDSIIRSKNMANCEGCSLETTTGPVPVGSYPLNPFKLHEVTGNVAEWVMDCYNPGQGYESTPVDGSAYSGGLCQNRVIRGAGWRTLSHFVSLYSRGKHLASYTSETVGFRIVLDSD